MSRWLASVNPVAGRAKLNSLASAGRFGHDRPSCWSRGWNLPGKRFGFGIRDQNEVPSRWSRLSRVEVGGCTQFPGAGFEPRDAP